MPNKSPDRPILSVRLTDGLADRNRLPLEHVIRVLNEVKGLLDEAAARLQEERGIAEPIDFGLELVAGFRRGSVEARLMPTAHVSEALAAAGIVLDTMKWLSAQSKRPTQGRQAPSSRIVGRLSSIGRVQKLTRTRLRLSIAGGGVKRKTAVYDDSAQRVAERLQRKPLVVRNLDLYGRLRELREKPDTDPDPQIAPGFLGELVRDNGELWRVEFRASDEEAAAALFRKQVHLQGDAYHYAASSPKLMVLAFGRDVPRDYENAFADLAGIDSEDQDTSLDALIREMRGDE